MFIYVIYNISEKHILHEIYKYYVIYLHIIIHKIYKYKNIHISSTSRYDSERDFLLNKINVSFLLKNRAKFVNENEVTNTIVILKYVKNSEGQI